MQSIAFINAIRNRRFCFIIIIVIILRHKCEIEPLEKLAQSKLKRRKE